VNKTVSFYWKGTSLFASVAGKAVEGSRVARFFLAAKYQNGKKYTK
jgi:hypothetical protein